ncbi:MAG: molybdopterin cofactor-binding domain-containing protein, partial [Novosphingobium sp.]
IFALQYGDYAGRRDALSLTKRANAGSFTGWLLIGEDDHVTLYTPHIDMGTGTTTALKQMAADELEADWDRLSIEPAPAEAAFANAWLAEGFLNDGTLGMKVNLPHSAYSAMARNLIGQITGGSSAVRFTGQYGFRVLAASARQALKEEAAARLEVPIDQLSTARGVVAHAATGRSLRYGELAKKAAQRSLDSNPKLKQPKDFVHIGKPVARIDIPAKVDGSAKYGIDFALPGMRVATVMAAPARGGKLESVDPAPAMAIKGVEKVVRFDDAVAVVAKGYWPALKGLRALSPQFTDGGNTAVSTASIFADQDKAIAGKAKAFDAKGGRLVKAAYRAPYVHHMMMEPFALTAQYKDGKLDVWGGLQDPLNSKWEAAKAAGLSQEDVTFHPMLLGGGFGRKLPGHNEVIGQAVRLAMQMPTPVKIIWPREEEVQQGTYRPQSTIALKAALGADGKIKAWQTTASQDAMMEAGIPLIYAVEDAEQRHAKHKVNILTASFRSVEASQHGFFHECFIDELAHVAGIDPYEFRKRNLPANSRAAKVLDAAARASGWETPLPQGTGRGIAVVESFGTVCAHVVQARLGENGYPKVEKVWAAVDCGLVVNPKNAEAQVMGGIVMGLSVAIHEEITVDMGAVQQSSFPDYPLLTLAETPEVHIEFVTSDAPMGGLGEPGLPPAAPALANALFAATGKRIRQLPIKAQAAS